MLAWSMSKSISHPSIHPVFLSIFINFLIYSFRLINENQSTPEISAFPTVNVLDPLLIDPLGRTRIKKLKTKPWIPDEQKPKVSSQ